jgi:hypothetical protein
VIYSTPSVPKYSLRPEILVEEMDENECI